jgi:hypothetical protein
MSFKLNNAITSVEAPPIAEALTWVRAERNRALIDLCQALPKYPPAEEVAREIGRLALEPSTNLYTDILGVGELRSTLAGHMADEYGGEITPSNVAITAGCNQAFAAAMMVHPSGSLLFQSRHVAKDAQDRAALFARDRQWLGGSEARRCAATDRWRDARHRAVHA